MIIRITSKYGVVSNLHSTGHTGVDIALNEGTPLRSISDGIIEKNYDGCTNIGKGVMVRFKDGSQGIYGHMSNVSFKEGEYIHDGQILGLSGDTGRSTGEHLHFAIKENGTFVELTSLDDQTDTHQSIWDSVTKTEGILTMGVETIGGLIYETFIGGGIGHWVSNYIMALSFLVGVSIGVWGLLNMVNSKLATLGVGFIMVLGGLVII